MTTNTRRSHETSLEKLQDEGRRILELIDQLLDLHGIVEVNRSNGYDLMIDGGQGLDKLINRKIDRNMVQEFKRQFKDRFKHYQSDLEALASKGKTSKIPRVVPIKPEGYINKLSYPIIVSDVARDFFKSVNLGNTFSERYVASRHPEGFFIDGRDVNAITQFHKRVFPQETLTEDDLKALIPHNHLSSLFESSAANGSILSYLFSLYTRVNKLQAKSSSRIHTSPQFMDHIFNKKVSYVVKGRDLLAGIDLVSHDAKIAELHKSYEDAEARKKLAKHNCENWRRADLKPPKDPKSLIYKLYNENNYIDLQREYTEAQNSLKVIHKQATDLLSFLFKTDKVVTNPAPVLKKLMNRNKTFGEVLKEYSGGNKKSDPYVPEGSQPFGTDDWGYSMTMVGVIKSYMMVPNIMLTQLDPQFTTFIKNDSVIRGTVDLENKLSNMSKIGKLACTL